MEALSLNLSNEVLVETKEASKQVVVECTKLKELRRLYLDKMATKDADFEKSATADMQT